MPAPSGNLPVWNTSQANQVEPSSGKKSQGYVVNEKPSSSNINWLLWQIGNWITYLSAGIYADSHTWSALQVFQQPGGDHAIDVLPAGAQSAVFIEGVGGNAGISALHAVIGGATMPHTGVAAAIFADSVNGAGVGIYGWGGDGYQGGYFQGGTSDSTGVTGLGGASNGHGVQGIGAGSGKGGTFAGGTSAGTGVSGQGGAGAGIGGSFTGGSTGLGVDVKGGATSGDAGHFFAQGGNSRGLYVGSSGSAAAIEIVQESGTGAGLYARCNSGNNSDAIVADATGGSSAGSNSYAVRCIPNAFWAPLHLGNSGGNPSNTQVSDIWYDGTNLKCQVAAGIKTIQVA